MTAETRPPRNYQTGPVTVWLRRGSVILTIAVTVLLLVRYASLPETVPTHFGLTGEADAWGPRWSLLALAALLCGVIFGAVWLSSRPQLFNYPIVITETNAAAVYREGERMLVWVTLATVLIYAATVFAAMGWSVSAVFLAVLLGLVLSVVVGLIRVVAARNWIGEDAE
ncbi:DUF1648 domain-containing protein, partial [Leucobacter sp. M11]|uniref:DUF1648 domain-containing protein n=1 Tax=Leucobacter sp. M11 TaxID=2993565 RepID=UPI002D80126B